MRLNLQYRVAIAFALFGAGLSLLLSLGIYVASHDLEERLIDETLSAEMQDYISRRQRNPHSPPPATATIKGFVRPSIRFEGDIPEQIRDLPAGRYRLELGRRPYRVAVEHRDYQWFYLLYDETQLLSRERRFIFFLGAAVLLATLIAAAMGRWLACRVVSPVGELADRVTRLRPEEPSEPLARDYPHDEVGELARAFDRYQQRLHGFIERERAFTADASHELRTPLTIIQGAAELLMSAGTLGDTDRQRVMRIARAAEEMSELTRALLTMGREESGAEHLTRCSVEGVLRQVLDSHAHLLIGKPVDVETEIITDVEVAAHRALLGVVIGNLVRNAFTYTDEGHIRIRVEPAQLVIEDTGPGIRREELEQVFQRHYTGGRSQGTGIGLSLVKRICDRYGWEVTLDSREPKGTVTRMRFGPPPQKAALDEIFTPS